MKVLEKARGEAQFPWLSANTYDKGSDKTHYAPYVVREVAGVRIGVLGLTTPGIPNWDNEQNYAGLEFHDPVVEARKWVGVLREKEKVDVVVVAMHMGLEEDLNTGEISPGQVPNENEAIAIAKQVPGINLILMGHTHRDVPSLVINGVLLTQADYWGRHVARVIVDAENARVGGANPRFHNGAESRVGGCGRIQPEAAPGPPLKGTVSARGPGIGLPKQYILFNKRQELGHPTPIVHGVLVFDALR